MFCFLRAPRRFSVGELRLRARGKEEARGAPRTRVLYRPCRIKGKKQKTGSSTSRVYGNCEGCSIHSPNSTLDRDREKKVKFSLLCPGRLDSYFSLNFRVLGHLVLQFFSFEPWQINKFLCETFTEMLDSFIGFQAGKKDFQKRDAT